MTDLLTLALNAPLVGVRKRWPQTLHAIDMEGLPVATWPNGKATSVCGLSGLRVVASGGGPVLWPPRVASLPDGTTRCNDCWDGTTPKRPRSEFVPRGALDLAGADSTGKAAPAGGGDAA